jgi:hypothetical protein
MTKSQEISPAGGIILPTETICDQDGKEMKTKKPFKTIPQRKKTGNYHFTSPSDQDWILILDDASKKLPAPGMVVRNE